MMKAMTMMTIIMKMIRIMILMITNCHDNHHRSIVCIIKGA